MRKKTVAVLAAASVGVMGLSHAFADSTIDYEPVVTVVGDGNPYIGGTGVTTSIDVFDNTLANQSGPLASDSYNAAPLDGTPTGLVNTNSTVEGELENNPAVDDAAAAGNSYIGTSYVFSAGYAGTDGQAGVSGAANRVVGYATVTPTSVTNPTIGASEGPLAAYANSTFRAAVGNDTATSYWTAGNGSNNTTSGFTDGYRYFNTNTQLVPTPGPVNTRAIQIRQGQLYGDSDTGAFVGVSVIGNGTPTSGGQTATLLFGSGTASSQTNSPLNFLLLDDPNNPLTPTANGTPVPFNVAYVSDNGAATTTDTSGGIQKWVYTGVNPTIPPSYGWSMAYTIGDSNNVGISGSGYMGLTGQLLTSSNSTNDSVVLFATTENGSTLERFTDPLEGTSSTPADNSLITLATAPANDLFRGVALAPIPTLFWDNAGATAPTDGVTWDVNNNINWINNSVPTAYNGPALVVLNDTNNGHYAVTLNAIVSPVSVTFNNSAGNYTISGSGSIAGAGPLTKNGSGTATLDTVNTYAGGTNVNAGTLVVGVNGALPNGSVTITSGSLQLAAGTGLAQMTSLAIAGNGTLDVNNDHAIINYGTGPDPIASIAALLATGYAGGKWNGAGGIVSSAAAVTPGYGLGYADSADPGNPANLSSGTIEIKYTLLGDANLDGVVNGIDFGILAANFNKGVTGWDEGDFNYDNVVNGIDFGELAANFNKGASGASFGPGPLSDPALVAFAQANGLMADVPEPASIGLLALGIVELMPRRRRSRN